MHDIFPPKRECSESRVLFKFWKQCMIEKYLQWKTNKKSYVAYRMAPLSMTFNDLEGHFC